MSMHLCGIYPVTVLDSLLYYNPLLLSHCILLYVIGGGCCYQWSGEELQGRGSEVARTGTSATCPQTGKDIHYSILACINRDRDYLAPAPILYSLSCAHAYFVYGTLSCVVV